MKKIIRKSLVLSLVVFLSMLFCAPAMIHADPVLVSVEITPEYGEIPALGQTIQYTATAKYDDDSEADVTATATWDIDDPSIATNNSGGLFTGVTSGGTMVTATFDGVTGSANLWVNQGSLGLSPGSPDEPTYFTLYATACSGLPWELVVTKDSTEILSASGTIPSDEWWGHEVSTTLSAGDYTAVFSIDGTVQDTINFSIWGFESSFDISVGYAGETTIFTLNATNSSGKTAYFYLDKDMGDGSWSLVYDEAIPVDSDDWSYTITQTLAVGNYWAGFWVEDYWAGGYDFSVVNRGVSQPPVEEKPAPKAHRGSGPAINEKPLSSYEKTISGFTTLFYNRFLKRPPEKNGLDSWTARLKSGEITGSDLVQQFIFGEECQNMISGYSDEEFLTFLYKAIFNRKPDEVGYNNWLSLMTGGMTRKEVVDRFTHSEEFVNLCKEFGVIPYEGYTNTEE